MMRRKTVGRPAFTLVELMIAVVIVVVLAGMVSVAGRRAVRRSEMAASISNLKQLSIANGGYVVDHGTYAPATDRRNRVRWHGGRESGRGSFDPRKGYLSSYLGNSGRVGQCPGLETHLSGDSSWEDGSGGYGYNAVYIGGTPVDPFQPTRPARIPQPSRTLMFATTALSKAAGLQEYPFAEPRYWVDPNGNLGGSLQPSLHFRFGGKALIAWCDGHVSAEGMTGSSEQNYYGGNNEAEGIGFAGPEESNGWWNPHR